MDTLMRSFEIAAALKAGADLTIDQPERVFKTKKPIGLPSIQVVKARRHFACVGR